MTPAPRSRSSVAHGVCLIVSVVLRWLHSLLSSRQAVNVPELLWTSFCRGVQSCFVFFVPDPVRPGSHGLTDAENDHAAGLIGPLHHRERFDNHNNRLNFLIFLFVSHISFVWLQPFMNKSVGLMFCIKCRCSLNMLMHRQINESTTWSLDSDCEDERRSADTFTGWWRRMSLKYCPVRRHQTF